MLESEGMLVGVACRCGRVGHPVHQGAVDKEELSASSCTHCTASSPAYRRAVRVQFQVGGSEAGSVKMLVAKLPLTANILDDLKGRRVEGVHTGQVHALSVGVLVGRETLFSSMFHMSGERSMAGLLPE